MNLNIKSFLKKKVILLASVTLISACVPITKPIIKSHGYAPGKTEIINIKNGELTQNDIVAEYGEPLVVGSYDPNYWYYFSYQTINYGFSKKQFKEFRLVEMYFRNGNLENIEVFNKDDLNDFAFNDEKTKTGGKELNVVDQFVGNIGKFRLPNQ